MNAEQKRIFNQILARNKVYYCKLDDSSTAVTCDGFLLSVLRTEDICFDLKKCKEADLSAYTQKTETDCRMSLTGVRRLNYNKEIENIECEDFNSWVDVELIKPYRDCLLYQAHPEGRILVYDPTDTVILGVVMPVRYRG